MRLEGYDLLWHKSMTSSWEASTTNRKSCQGKKVEVACLFPRDIHVICFVN